MFSFILSILGLFNAIYLTSLKFLQQESCFIGSSCNDVINSSYGMILGLPTSIYGVLFFSLISYISYQRFANNQPSIGFELVILILGSLFSVYLMFAQFILVKSFCVFCSFSAAITFILTGLSIFRIKSSKNVISLSTFKPAKPIMIGALILMSLLIAFIVFSVSITQRYSVTFTPSLAATSSIKTFTTDELDNLAGIEHTKLKMQLQSLRERTFGDYLARYDAGKLGLQLDDYYRVFVQKKLSVNDENIRNSLKRIRGDHNSLLQFLSTMPDADKNDFRDRFFNLQDDILELYKGSFLLKTTFKTNIEDNAYGAIQKGKSKAPLNVVIFSDYLCGHCAHFHKEFKPILEKYSSYFSITYRNFPLRGQLSDTLSLLGICSANQGLYDEYADAIYKNQRSINTNNVFEFIPSSLDVNRLKTCINDPVAKGLLADDVKEVKRLNIQSTPTIFLNGFMSNINIIKAELEKLTGKKIQPDPSHSHHNDHGDHSH
jgi:uncharacterized membrane protein